MFKKNWTRGDTLGLASIIIAVVGCILALILPETRAWLGLDSSKKDALQKEYNQKLQDWNNFSPNSLSGTPQTAIIPSGTYFDLEKGVVSDEAWDLEFRCWKPPGESSFHEYLFGGEGVSWHEVGVADFKSFKYRDVRDAKYHLTQQIFKVHGFDIPGKNFIYFIKTSKNNVAKIQILSYIEKYPVIKDGCRDLKLRYEVFPITNDPPKPTAPH